LSLAKIMATWAVVNRIMAMKPAADVTSGVVDAVVVVVVMWVMVKRGVDHKLHCWPCNMQYALHKIGKFCEFMLLEFNIYFSLAA